VAVERITDLRTREIRKLEIEFGTAIAADAFAGVAGIRDAAVENDTLRCTVVGSMDPVLKAANRYEIRALSSVEPSLEEVFLAYYGEATGDAA